MQVRLLAVFFILFAIFCGCNNHFVTDATERAVIEKDFAAKKAEMPDGDLFSVFGRTMTTEEREALTFLYAYMPAGDITDYDGDFYLANVRSALQTRREMSWGRKIPDKIFRHFVLPVRVNNEALDSSRLVFYRELRERIKGLSLKEAILEVNHWCHEKVTYAPSDARTSSSLASVRTAFGRCGEESTFAVATLRSVGIPARQVYTPRWVHTDDNHAWVEAWVDGEWVFMGACEPEPVLNLGWFNAPASRGILMHTKVFGRYEGAEEVMEQTPVYTEINVIDHYAESAKATVRILDTEDQVVEGAKVDFKVYNYAEFYSVATKMTDTEGQCTLTAGKGDVLVWATKNDRYGYAKLSFGSETEKDVVLNKQVGDTETVAFDFIPPAENVIAVPVTDAQQEENSRRMQEEDAIRNAYVSDFYTKERAETLAEELGTDTELTVKYLIASRGNHREIECFLRETPVDRRSLAIMLLSVISAKDLRDAPAAILADHLNYVAPDIIPSERYAFYVLNPRIGLEMLSPYKSLLSSAFAKLSDGEFSMATFSKEPLLLAKWVKENIRVKRHLNPQRIPMSPYGVFRSRVADENSRNIFFIASARTLGVSARFEPITYKVQFFDTKTGTWVDVHFEDNPQIPASQGFLLATFRTDGSVDDPKYDIHFTVARLHSDGRIQTLDLPRSFPATGALVPHNTWSRLLKEPFPLDEGSYLLVTGTRFSNGTVLSQATFFNIEAGKTTTVPLVMRENNDGVIVIGEFNSESVYLPAAAELPASILSTTGRGYFVVGLLASHQEPTNHALRDLAAVKSQLEEWGRPILLLFPDEKALMHFDADEFGILPSTVNYGIDINSSIRKEIIATMKLPSTATFPIFIVADTFNRVLFVSQGYTIGLGEQLITLLRKL
ncbi:MAG: transglutaminase domain-containing protein [Tannerellaceae bacterium]|jgi:transglutaminase-like putative cysteine protease|nr:transglutaminase domain-containing protein [Tannerellaceae bacterium]